MKTLGERIFEARKAKRMSLRQLSDLAALSPMFISQVENGRRTPVNGRSIAALAKALDLDEKNLKETAALSVVSQKAKKDLRGAQLALARKLIVDDDIDEETINSIIAYYETIRRTKAGKKEGTD